MYRRFAHVKFPEQVLDGLKANEISLAAAARFAALNDTEVSLEILGMIRGQGQSAS